MLERDIMAYELMIEDIEMKWNMLQVILKIAGAYGGKEELIEKMDSHDNWAELSETL